MLTGRELELQYIPRNMHMVFALLCFVVVIHWLIFPYPSGLLHWHCGNLTIAPVPAKQPWWIWINTSCEIIMNDCITTTKQSTTKPCAYFLGYTVLTVICFWLRASPSQFDYKRLEDVIKLCICNLSEALAFILSQGGWIHISSLDHWDQHNMLITAGEAMVNIHISLNINISHCDVSACHKIYGPPFYVLCYDCELATLKC